MSKLFSKKGISISIFAILFVMLASATAFAAYGNAVYSDAILYSIDASNVLVFNVLHSADITGAVIVDKTKSGINTINDLKTVLGTPDAGAPVFGIDPGQRTIGKAVTATLEVAYGFVVKATITNVRDRPIIGITKRTFNSTAPGNSNEVFWAGAFERNGAIAVYLDTVVDADGARAYVSKLDGIFVCGGEDWHPALYNETVTPHGSSGWNIGRDISDINLMWQAISLDVPMLAACRGHQGFNIAMGGGLVQDIPYYLAEEVEAGRIAANRVTGLASPNSSTHREYKYEDIIDANGNLIPYSGTGAAPYTTVSCDATCRARAQVDGLIHSGGTSYHVLDVADNVGVLPDSKWLYNIIGSRYMAAVATAHHQSVNPKKLGNGITIAAYSSDGVVEAIEHKDSLFALGIQWHPERDAGGGTSGIRNGYVDPDSSNALLRALVKYASIHMDRQNTPNLVDPYAGYTVGELDDETPSMTVTQDAEFVIITITNPNPALLDGDNVKFFFKAIGNNSNSYDFTQQVTGEAPFEVKISTKSLTDAGLLDGEVYAVNYTNGMGAFGTTTFLKGLEFDDGIPDGGNNNNNN
ncbi:MAG: gamma-glutamyl-gamma-aminobutyrate hydrolase family protein, partial [Oscillospiraceae bacterium]|nr:gamma-glutamyl-gamma-aminobutyrate hydrolase family protein [Oscillospiraceae bacterium]